MYHKEALLAIEIINFITEALAFGNKHLNEAHSISDVKVTWKK